MHPQVQDELLTPAEVARLLYVDPKTVTRWAAAGKLSAIRTPGGHRRYLRSEVLALLAGLHPGQADDHFDQDASLDAGDEVGAPRQAAAAAIVAEAVALAAEAAAADAAEAVLATAAAVTEAAGRAAAAAQSAREARSIAAEAAARCVVVEAERTAVRVRLSADLAAARVEHAATTAARELARLIQLGGVPLDPGHLAQALAATVLAAANATDEDTTRAADAVSSAATDAATDLALTLHTAEDTVEREVAAVAVAQLELATATALATALETDARAADVAQVAVDAAAAVVTRAQLDRSLDIHTHEITAELSHDLRIPLSSIVASIELLQDELRGHSDVHVASLLARSVRASERMVRMLEQNMRPPHGTQSVAVPEVDLDEVVRQLLMDLSDDVLEPASAVVETGLLPVVRADPDEMYSVLQNLVTNSVKFARPGVPARIRISARRLTHGWRISVRDNGVGLPETSGLDVFSLFNRGAREVAGHGIGLATVARIVAEHGGRVGSTPMETGAVIWFEIPEDEVVR